MGTIDSQDIYTFTHEDLLESRNNDDFTKRVGFYEPVISKNEKTKELFDNAACKDSPHLFFLYGVEAESQESKEEREEKAKAVCRGCAVIDLCHEYVLENPGVGVYAGMTEEERDRAGMPSLARNVSSYNRGHAEKRWARESAE